jgi:hypothetical protein
MRDILAICREHGQPPSWWSRLDHTDRLILLADLRARATAPRPGVAPRKVGR